MKRLLSGVTALAAAVAFVHPATATSDSRPLVTTQPDPTADVAPWFVSDSDPRWSNAEWSAADIAALRKKIKYVFVIFNENRSFDHEYGSFPGANGLYSDGLKPRSAGGHARLFAVLSRHGDRQERDRAAVPRRPARKRVVQGLDRPFPHGPRRQDRRARRGRENGQVRRSRVAPLRERRRREGREAGNAVRPAGDGACRLRHDPLLLALRQPLHDLRQHLRHRGHAVHPERESP